MAKASTMSPAAYQRILLYGPPKGGKTRLALAVAEIYNVIYFGLENGHVVVFQLPMEWQERIEIIAIPDSRSFPIAAETMLKVIKGGEHSICEIHGKVLCLDCMKHGLPSVKVCLDGRLMHGDRKTVVIVDSLTQFTTSAIAHITKDQDELYKLQTDDWGQLSTLIDIFLSSVQVARYHCICISHETEADLEDNTKRIVPVAGSRNSSRNTAKYFDHVIYCSVRNSQHKFGSSTLYSNGILTGSRTNATIEDMKEASLLDILEGKVQSMKSPTPGEVAGASLNSLVLKLEAKDNPLNALKRNAEVPQEGK